MSKSFPTKWEIRCAGISLIVSHILLMIAFFLHSIDYDVYNVKNEEDIILFHDAVSSSEHRIQIEIAVVLMWISFPLLLTYLYGGHKVSMAIYESTSGEIWVYLYEKAYIIWITVVMIILPALSLVSVSYDWSFSETPSDTTTVPTGYHIQLFVILLELEIIDCVSVADAIFMISNFALGLIMLHGAKKGDKKFDQFRQIVVTKMSRGSRIVAEGISICCVLSLFIIFLIILFEFAESGFFSITGYAKVFVIWVFICKMFIGLRFVAMSKADKYDEIKRIFGKNDASDQHSPLQMKTIVLAQ
eukprot:250702_1